MESTFLHEEGKVRVVLPCTDSLVWWASIHSVQKLKGYSVQAVGITFTSILIVLKVSFFFFKLVEICKGMLHFGVTS